jgi:hypothetical protein
MVNLKIIAAYMFQGYEEQLVKALKTENDYSISGGGTQR